LFLIGLIKPLGVMVPKGEFGEEVYFADATDARSSATPLEFLASISSIDITVGAVAKSD
jgi:hypothetical protein